MKTIEEIAEMLEEATREWQRGEQSNAYFMARVAGAYAQLAQAEIIGSAVNEHNQVMIKTSPADGWDG